MQQSAALCLFVVIRFVNCPRLAIDTLLEDLLFQSHSCQEAL